MISAKSVEVGKISQNVAKMVKQEPRADSIPFGEDVNEKIPDVAVMKSPEVSAT